MSYAIGGIGTLNNIKPVDPSYTAAPATLAPTPYSTSPYHSNRRLRYASLHPLYGVDWACDANGDWLALSLFREGFQNRIQVVHGTLSRDVDEYRFDGGFGDLPTSGSSVPSDELRTALPALTSALDFSKVTETAVDYPVTHLQWDPHMLSPGSQRLAVLLEVLRLYRMTPDPEPTLVQTHLLANNSTAAGSDAYDINTFPPVTSFDWNRTDPSVLITLSVDTTCTVWDLARLHPLHGDKDTAHVKTQLIAHDLEVFDVQFLHHSTSVFASVSNDGLMRVFDLRLLEHSTIIYEPTNATVPPPHLPATHYNPLALVALAASNVDQHHLATVGVNLNQVLVIDMRMPGAPATTVDALFGGISTGAVNLIAWHPLSNLLLTGGDDCQALVWDIGPETPRPQPDANHVVDTPALAHSEDLEVNQVCWRGSGDWVGVVSGKSFQAVQI